MTELALAAALLAMLVNSAASLLGSEGNRRAASLPAAAAPVLLAGAVATLLALEPVRRSTRARGTAFLAGLAFGGVALTVRPGWVPALVAGLAQTVGGVALLARRR